MELSSSFVNVNIDEFEQQNRDFKDFLNSLNIKDVPILDKTTFQSFKDGQLVRFYGMIQDMMNPEYFHTKYNVSNKDSGITAVKSGMFRDTIILQPNEEYVDEVYNSLINLKERLPLFCVPVPGLNDWVLNLNKVVSPDSGLSLETPSRKKRNLDEETTSMETNDTETSTKRSPSSTPQSNITQTINVNSVPLTFQDGQTCLVKIYEELGQAISLNDRVEIVGFLSVSPYESEFNGDSRLETTWRPPPSLVPRLHALSVKKLKHLNPLLPQEISNDVNSTEFEQIRRDLHLALTQLLFGDTIAADYLICHLISKVYVKKEYLKLGHYSLNLFGVKIKDYGKQLYTILEQLVPQSYYLPLSISHMNSTNFVPKKDYDQNKLTSGVLQLADNTELVIDETQLEEGQLNDLGCRNTAALHALVQQQSVQYNFTFYNVDYDTDIPVLILSEGKSFIQTDVQVKLNVDTTTASTIKETFQAAKFYLNKELMDRIRCYLTTCRLLEFDISSEIMKIIEDDFVNMRQADPKVTQNDLHLLLVLARLVSLSHGMKIVTQHTWHKAKEMEQERRRRML